MNGMNDPLLGVSGRLNALNTEYFHCVHHLLARQKTPPRNTFLVLVYEFPERPLEAGMRLWIPDCAKSICAIWERHGRICNNHR